MENDILQMLRDGESVENVDRSSGINSKSSEIKNQSSETKDRSSETKDNKKQSLQQADLWQISEIARKRERLPRDQMEGLIITLCTYRNFTIKELSSYLNRQPDSLRVSYIRKLVKEGRLEPVYKMAPTHPKQAYQAKAE
ncbi:hypothetical protein ABNN70_05995 [Sporolactobacillus sp. Y61]|uniref:Winged helix-turn-helix domain-containing protein n=1 Tax=Sporolactobacillus sp. Y61 TaxID=3160863 RepID=A0AAU8II63_9BACL